MIAYILIEEVPTGTLLIGADTDKETIEKLEKKPWLKDSVTRIAEIEITDHRRLINYQSERK
ncbi:MAG: hypothetical protein K0S80_2621 [Neobacillus sp.]|nr:hypothetical protein [Neobacillus sp.]